MLADFYIPRLSNDMLQPPFAMIVLQQPNPNSNLNPFGWILYNLCRIKDAYRKILLSKSGIFFSNKKFPFVYSNFKIPVVLHHNEKDYS